MLLASSGAVAGPFQTLDGGQASDGRGLRFELEPSNPVAGVPFEVRVQVINTLNQTDVPQPGIDVQLMLEGISGATIASGDEATTDGAGLATFSAVLIEEAGENGRLRAIAPSHEDALSTTFDVEASGLAYVVFEAQPADVATEFYQGVALPTLRICAVDNFDNRVEDVRLSLTAVPSVSTQGIPSSVTTGADGCANWDAIVVNAITAGVTFEVREHQQSALLGTTTAIDIVGASNGLQWDYVVNPTAPHVTEPFVITLAATNDDGQPITNVQGNFDVRVYEGDEFGFGYYDIIHEGTYPIVDGVVVLDALTLHHIAYVGVENTTNDEFIVTFEDGVTAAFSPQPADKVAGEEFDVVPVVVLRDGNGQVMSSVDQMVCIRKPSNFGDNIDVDYREFEGGTLVLDALGLDRAALDRTLTVELPADPYDYYYGIGCYESGQNTIFSVESNPFDILPNIPSTIFRLDRGRAAYAGCSTTPARFQIRDAHANPSPSLSTTSYALQSPSTGRRYYADPACTESITSIPIVNGQTDFSFYYSDTNPAVDDVTIVTDFGTFNSALNVVVGGIRFDPTSITTPATVCSAPIVASLDDNGAPYNLVQDVDVTVWVDNSTTMVVFAADDSACGTPLNLNSGSATISLTPEKPTFTFRVMDTTATEPFQSYRVYFGDPANDTFSQYDSISVDVPALVADGLNFVRTPPDVMVAGETFVADVEATIDGSRATDWTESIRLSYAASPSGAPTLNRSSSPTNGLATFANVQVTTTGTYLLRAGSGSGDYLNETSDAFTVVPAAPDRFSVTADAASAFVNTCSQPIRVHAFDAFDNAYFSSSATALSFNDLGNPNFGIYSSAAACNADSTSSLRETVALQAGETEAVFFIKSSVAEVIVFQTTFPGLSPRNVTVAISDPSGAQLSIDSVGDPVQIGTEFGLQASIRDQAGQLMNWPADVTVEVMAGAPGALTGTTTILGGDGNLFFDDLMLDAVGTYTLEVRTGALVAQREIEATVGPPAHVRFLTDAKAPSQNTCSGEVRFRVEDIEGNLAAFDGGAVSVMSVDPPTVDLFSDAACSVPLVAPREIPLVGGEGVFSFRSSLAGPVTTTATVGAVEGSQAHSVYPTGTQLPEELRVTAVQTPLTVNACSGAVDFALYDDSGDAAGLPAPATLTLTADADDVTFFVGDDCSTPLSDTPADLPLSSSTQQGTLSFRASAAGSKTITLSIPGIPAATFSRVVVDEGVAAPTALRFETPARTTQVDACSAPVRVAFVDANGDATPLPVAVQVDAAFSPAFSLFEGDCTGAAVDPTSGILLEAGTTEIELAFSSTAAASTTLTLSSAGLTSASQLLTVQAGVVEPTPLALRFTTAPFQGPAGSCAQEVRLALEDEDGQTVVLEEDLSITLGASSPTVNFFAVTPENTCDIAPLSGGQLVLPAGASTISFHFIDPNPGVVTLTARADAIAEASQLHTFTDAELSAPVIAQTANPNAAVGIAYVYSTERVAELVRGSSAVQWSVVDNPDGTRSPEGFLINRATGFVTWTPNASQVGAQQVSIRADGGPLGDDVYTFVVDVISEEDASNRDAPEAVLTVESDSSGPATLHVVVSASGSSTADPEGVTPLIVWDFGDGTRQVSGVNAAHDYALPGSYVIKLRVQDSVGRVANASAVISVLDGSVDPPLSPPKALIAAEEQTSPTDDSRTFDLSCTCTDGSTPIVSYRWELDNGLTSNQPSVSPTFGPGGHLVRLTVADENGLVATDTYEVVVAPQGQTPPLVNAVADPVTAVLPANGEGVTVRYSAIYGDVDGEVTSVRWILDNAEISTNATTTNNFNRLGTYEVRFEAEDDDGLVTTRTVTTRITAPNGFTAPEIVSVPTTTAAVGTPYRYSAEGRVVVRGSRPLSFALGYEVGGEVVGRPNGMSIHPDTGVISWTPAASNGSEVHVSVVVSNRNGDETFFEVQDFLIALEGGVDVEPEAPPPTECQCSDTGEQGAHVPGWALAVLFGAGVVLRRKRQQGA